MPLGLSNALWIHDLAIAYNALSSSGQDTTIYQDRILLLIGNYLTEMEKDIEPQPSNDLIDEEHPF